MCFSSSLFPSGQPVSYLTVPPPSLPPSFTSYTESKPTLEILIQLGIINRVYAKWRQLGVRLGQSMGDLDNYERKEMFDKIKCCMRVFDSWINSGGTSVYPLSWKGVYDVLCDIDDQGTAEDMKSAVATMEIHGEYGS